MHKKEKCCIINLTSWPRRVEWPEQEWGNADKNVYQVCAYNGKSEPGHSASDPPHHIVEEDHCKDGIRQFTKL